MINLKKYTPDRFIAGPRWIELFIQTLLFTCVLVFQSYLGIDLLLGNNSFFFNTNSFDWGAVLFTWILFFCYKVGTTHTVTDSIVIDYNKDFITFSYWFIYFIKKEKTIFFNELSFNTIVDLLIFGGAKSIRVYQNNKYKIKLNPRNGWKKEQMDDILKEFLVITNGKMRKKRWQL
jgi:hypothetical protein